MEDGTGGGRAATALLARLFCVKNSTSSPGERALGVFSRTLERSAFRVLVLSERESLGEKEPGAGVPGVQGLEK